MNLIPVLAASLLASSILQDVAPGDPRPVTVFVARKIHTMDPGWPVATAVAVRDGKILAVGTLDDVKLSLGQTPFDLDESFKDKFLLPGFIEAHGHPLIGAITLTRPLLTYLPTAQAYGPDFPGVKTLAEATAKLKEYVDAETDPHRTVLVWGYDVVAMGRHLDREFLDAISARQPLMVWDASEHMVYANSAAIKAAGLTRAAASINGVGVGKDGELNGQFLGTTAAQFVLVKQLAPLLEPKIALKNMKFLADLSRKNGITTTSELVFGAVDLDVERKLFDAFFDHPDGTLRCVIVTDGTTLARTKKDAAIDYVKGLEAQSTDRRLFRGVKFFADDSFLGLGMQIVNPGYSDGHVGLWMVEPGKPMFEQWRPWWDAGFHIHVHTNGNAGNGATIDALAALQRHKPRFDHRFTCEHFGISTPEQARRLKTLGGLASINPYYLHDRAELNAPLVGADRSYTAARLRTLVDAGVPVSMHSDTPVGTPRPLEWVWIAVNRFGRSGTVRGPGERVTPTQAFRMVTIDAAYTLGVEDRFGSIETGKFADFAVLEEDPFEVPVEKIREVKVWGTVLGGKVFPASEIRP
jgi:predicted amidohydrolase YtcJ